MNTTLFGAPALLLLLVATTHPSVCRAFSPSLDRGGVATTTTTTGFFAESIACGGDGTTGSPQAPPPATTRRNWLGGAVAAATLASSPRIARAGDAPPAAPPLATKEFVDPAGFFALRVPEGFYTLRRTQKGDLPDARTGRGRRGSSIFTAGNMAKAEVVAVERFPTRVLLEENGIEATGDLGTFPAIGEARAVASLIVARREKDAANQGARVLESVEVSPDGKTLSFRLKTEIDVQKPELLLEQTGVSRLFRVTVAKATLDAGDGNIMAIFASALEQDFANGVDGPALEDTVRSFAATVRSPPPASS